jgi:hypothetical protein
LVGNQYPEDYQLTGPSSSALVVDVALKAKSLATENGPSYKDFYRRMFLDSEFVRSRNDIYMFNTLRKSNGEWDQVTPGGPGNPRDINFGISSHTHSIGAEPNSGKPHNNLPPYVAIAYYQKIPI